MNTKKFSAGFLGAVSVGFGIGAEAHDNTGAGATFT